MNLLSRIWFPVAVTSAICLGIASEMDSSRLVSYGPEDSEPSMFADTVVYPTGGWRQHRVGSFDAAELPDSLLAGSDSVFFDEGGEEELDTLPKLTARDTIHAPDSLREIDPFRYKYYVALLDSLTHVIVRDSLKHSEDSLMNSFRALLSPADTIPNQEDSLRAYADSLQASLDHFDWTKLDSLYAVDSLAAAKARFEAWYNSLSKEERKKYDFEQKELAKRARMDSIQAIKDEKQAIKDSIRKNTPRVLEAFAIPSDMRYHRIIAWTEDRDFHDLDIYVPDTSYNYHFYDYPWQRKDVNATWLGVAGSPVQTYNFFNRKSTSGVEFYAPLEQWSYTPQTLVQYNTKTPFTEFAYYGTLFSTNSKESDNVHFLTTQNILPALNFTLSYDRWGGGGMLINEKVDNRTFAAALNYVGKKYMAHAGFISNTVNAGENGGIDDIFWIRDTTVEVREIKVRNTSAKSEVKKTTVFVDQQLCIPFNFIDDIKAKLDTNYVVDSTKSVPTAYIGHSLEYSKYSRAYNDAVSDSLGQNKLDAKAFIRLQPWADDALLSKIDVGIGDYSQIFDEFSASGHGKHKENSIYTYAGAKGQFGDSFDWSGRAHYVFGGSDAGNFDISGNAALHFYPFRKARRSPLSIGVEASTSLARPTYYQRHMYTSVESLRWDNSFTNISVSKVEGLIDIPYWKFDAKLGYALLAGNTYYGTDGVIRQNGPAMSVISGYIRKDFKVGKSFHFDNKLLFQYSSNQEVMPLPLVSANLKYYFDFVVVKNPRGPGNVMTMQIGANIFCNSPWYSPEWNPVLGVYQNQNETEYTNGPYFDVFVNIQWKRACIFLKGQNLGQGWPMDHADYFSAHRHIVTQGAGTGFKIGIYWPFYAGPEQNRKALNK